MRESRESLPKRISSIIVANAAQITTDAIQLAMEYNIDIVFVDKYGDPYGRIWYPKLGSTTYIRRKLLEIYDRDEGLEAVKNMGWTKNTKSNFFSQTAREETTGIPGWYPQVNR